MNYIEAIYQGGIFKPLGHVPLSDNQRVQLQFQTVEDNSVAQWLEATLAMQGRIIDERGYLTDSAIDIAADRTRNE